MQRNYTFFQPFAAETDRIIRGTSLDHEPSMEEILTGYQAITRLKGGDLSGLDVLIERYQLRAVRAAYLIVRERPLAEDIVQEAFVQLARKIHNFDEGRSFAPWFLRCVVNDALKAVQWQKRQVPLDEVEAAQAVELLSALADSQPGPEAQALQAETNREVWQALEVLAPEQRAVIVQRYYLGYSEAEMSASLQRPAGTVKWLLHTARKRLRILLATLGPPVTPEEEKQP